MPNYSVIINIIKIKLINFTRWPLKMQYYRRNNIINVLIRQFFRVICNTYYKKKPTMARTNRQSPDSIVLNIPFGWPVNAAA